MLEHPNLCKCAFEMHINAVDADAIVGLDHPYANIGKCNDAACNNAQLQTHATHIAKANANANINANADNANANAQANANANANDANANANANANSHANANASTDANNATTAANVQ